MEQKKRVRFGVIDFFIIICLISACFFFSYYAANRVRKNAAAAANTLSYTVKITNLSESSADLLVLNDNVCVTETTASAGKITNIKKSPHTFLVPSAYGTEYIYRTDDSRFDVMLTIESGFSEDETSFIVGGSKLKIGQQLHLFSDRISFTGTVCDIIPGNN